MFGLRLLPFPYPRPRAAARSYQGAREENQDNYLIVDGAGRATFLVAGREHRRQLSYWPRDHWRFCVLDGMGGHRDGGVFVDAALQALLQEPFGPRRAARRRNRLYAIHQALYQRYHLGPDSPGCTLVWADLRPDGTLHLLNLGDSRAWLWRDRAWRLLTRDHTEAEFLQRDGDPPRGDAPERAISQALGFGSFGLLRDPRGHKPPRASGQLRLDLPGELPADRRQHADLVTLRLQRGDRLLLASDGLWSGGIGDTWQEWIQGPGSGQRNNLEDQVRDLLLRAQDAGADDNLTAVLCAMGPARAGQQAVMGI